MSRNNRLGKFSVFVILGQGRWYVWEGVAGSLDAAEKKALKRLKGKPVSVYVAGKIPCRCGRPCRGMDFIFRS